MPSLRTLLIWSGIALAIYWLVKNPLQGDALLHKIGALASEIATSASTFVSHI